MSEQAEQTEGTSRERRKLVVAGTLLLAIGVVAWLVALTAQLPAALSWARSFSAVGMGLLVGGAVQNVARLRGSRWSLAAGILAAGVTATMMTYLLGDVGAVLIR